MKTAIKIGCDIVEIRRFRNAKKDYLGKIFYDKEIRSAKPETLAGLFGAKECCRKVFNGLKWHDIIINRQKYGKPVLSISKNKLKKINILSSDLSISHDGEYAIATAVFMIKHV
ncbi:MAG: hypothetical protein AABX33_08840 [Nanoarchaeota archaeon]